MVVCRWEHLKDIGFGVLCGCVQFPVVLYWEELSFRLVSSLEFSVHKLVSSMDVKEGLCLLLLKKSKKRCFLWGKVCSFRLYFSDGDVLVDIMM